ncbi:MAG: hypothetical protein ACXAC5_01325 [Promethearchaeota archaeon]|jgi:hypothetical protein
MSTSRELRERFKQESAIKVRAEVSELLGLTAQDMRDLITNDITQMIEKGYRVALEGYVLCLSRIINHKTAWECIVEAFRAKNEKVPNKYYPQFGYKPDDNILPPQTGIKVQ